MKILQVMAGAEHGGAETAFVDLCLAMHEAGQDIEVVTRANDNRVPMLKDAGIPVHTLPFGGAVDIYTQWRLGKIIEKVKPTIVQTWMSRAAQKTPNRRDVKNAPPFITIARLGGHYPVKNFRNSDYFVVNTPDLVNHLTHGGIAPDRIRHINNFAQTDEVVVPVSRRDLDTPEDALVLVTLARLHEAKAIDVLLQALADVPGAYAWLAGEGPDREKLEQMAKDLGVWERVRFLGWRNDRSALLQAADLCVFPSRVEPFGAVFVQAWANRTPVIVSDADGPRQYCIDGEDSLMVPRDDVKALASAINRLAADKALQEKITARGYERYLDEFTKEKSVSAYLEYYIDLLKRENLL